MANYVCRTCLYVCNHESSYKLVENVKEMLELCIPEIKLYIEETSIICRQCYYFLKTVQNFKIKCIQNQKKLINLNITSLQQNYNQLFKLAKNDTTLNDQQKSKPDNWLMRNSFFNNDTPESSNNNNNNSSNVIIEKLNNTFGDEFLQLLDSSANTNIKPCDNKPNTSPQKENSTSSTNRIIIKNNSVITLIDTDTEECAYDDELELKNDDLLIIKEEEPDDIFVEGENSVPQNPQTEREVNPKFFNKRFPDGLYHCNLCDKKYTLSTRLYKHTKKSHSEVKFYHCTDCNFFSLHKSAISHHKMVFHISKEIKKLKDFTCYQCNKNFPTKHSLYLHNKAHANFSFQCFHCNSQYASKYGLKRHLESKHTKK